MRYLKVLLLAIFLFLALIFFFQNQTPLSTEMKLHINLFFIPPMTSITLPFYFLLVCAFFIGCLLAVCMLFWDKITVSTRMLRSKMKIRSLTNEIAKLNKQLDEVTKNNTVIETHALPQAQAVKQEPSKAQPVKTETVKAEPVKDKDKKDAPKTADAKAEPVKAETVKPADAKAESAKDSKDGKKAGK